MINKVYVRVLLSQVVTNYLVWQNARAAAAGFGLVNARRGFETALAEMAGYLGGFDNAVSPSPIWREAFRVAALWRRDHRVTKHAMDRLIGTFSVHLGTL